jgi:signal transduction histidine kinase
MKITAVDRQQTEPRAIPESRPRRETLRIDYGRPRKRKHERRGALAMDVRTTAFSMGPQSQESDPFLIDRGALRSLLSNLSHELCRPLISLRTGFDLLLGESPLAITSDQRGHLLTMVSLCDDLLRLTRSYLDYAAIVQGSRPLCLGSFTVGALIHEIDRQFAPVASSRQIKWLSRAEPPEAVVVTDASRCQQIFGNLVSNALKYTPVGGEVRVAGKVDAESWSLIVSDSGLGIPTDALGKVFEPFFRLPRDEYSAMEGSGLGLAICRELVIQLQGEIVLNSIVGQGTSISVRFPKG